ncbi:MAG TPA: phage minor head protein [Bacteroidia bacterium]|nr:phage minor head protein [Bacteroidia bacterium]
MQALPFDEAIAWAKKRKIIPPNVYYSEANIEYRTLTFSVAGISNLNTLSDILDSLVKNLETGETFETWKQGILSKNILPENRLYTVYHTNIQSAFNSGIYERQKESEELYGYYMYSAVNDSKTRPQHKAWNGFIARADDPFWKTNSPLCGYNCRCRRIALNESQAIKRGYGKQSKPDQEPAEKDFQYDKTRGLKSIPVGVSEAETKAKDRALQVEKSINENTKQKKSLLYEAFLSWLISKIGG